MHESALDHLPSHQRVPAAPKATRCGLGFAASVQAFREFGAPTLEVREGPIRYLINEFWTSAQRQAHSLHEVSYRACFKPQLPAFFIARLTVTGEAVYDPFMGRG